MMIRKATKRYRAITMSGFLLNYSSGICSTALEFIDPHVLVVVFSVLLPPVLHVEGAVLALVAAVLAFRFELTLTAQPGDD